MKWRNSVVLAIFLFAGADVWLAGCGSSSANVVTVTVSPSAATVLAGQTQNFTATVAGATVLTVTNWPCTYSYTPLPTQAQPSPKAQTGTCTSGGSITGVTGKIGTWTISTANSSNVLSYVAPALADFPIPAPTLTFAATADADTKKTGTATVQLDSGISVSVTPATATVPVGLTPAQTAIFYPSFLNANPSGQQFKLVQPNTASSTTADQTATPQTPDTCDQTCGTIDNATGVYTAPATLPTDTTPSGSKSTAATTVYVVTWNAQDPTRYAIATITLVSAATNAVSFNGIYPASVAAGGLLQDVFLDAKNLLNTTLVNFVPPTAQSALTANSGTPLDPTTQIFTIPISSEYCTASAANVTPVVTCPDASLMTRVRLKALQLTNPEPDPQHPAWIMIPNLPGSATPSGDCVLLTPAGAAPTAIACPLHIVNASPGLVAAAPDSFPQSTQLGSIQVGIDGGYYGASSNLVNVSFNGQGVYKPGSNGGSTVNQTGARKLIFTQSNFQLPNPGLYEITVTNNSATGTPPTFLTATTNASIQPNFANAPIPLSVPLNTTAASGTNLAPSSIALNSIKGYAVIAEQASGTLQLVDLTGTIPVQLGGPVSISPGSQPTSIAIDDQIQVNGGDLLTVVSSGDQKLYLYSVSKASPFFTPITSIPVDLNTLLGEPSATGLPLPFAFGVDHGTHLGVVAYAGTNFGTNIGFIVDINPNQGGTDTHTCFLSGSTPPCVVAPVSMVTGPTPQVVVQPDAPLAYVTPGGGNGATSVVNLLQQGTSVKILPAAAGSQTASGAFRAAGITTIKTALPHGINPALGGTVIIAGVMTSTANSNFNGTFAVAYIDPYTFSYAQTGMPDDTETNTSSNEGTVQYGVPYYSFSTSTNASGAAVNPVTHTFAYADFQSSNAQIGFISTLDQSLTTLSLSAGSCNGCTPTVAGGTEINFRSVAFDPFTNVLLAYNPGLNVGANYPENAISLINPGGPAAGGGNTAAYRIIAAIPTGQIGTGTYTPSGATNPTTVFGPMAYDPKSKFALVANAGSNTLTYMNLDPGNKFQPIHIQSLQLPATACASAQSCYAVPTAQPPLPTSGVPTPSTTCNSMDPVHPCMPQAVQVGKTATVQIFGQGFGPAGTACNQGASGTLQVRLDQSATGITCTVIADNEVDATISAATLFAAHDFALDVQLPAAGAGSLPITSNAIDLHAVEITNMTPACAPTAAFPQGPEAVAIDEPRRVALVTNYACNSVSFINIDTTGTMYPGVPYGSVLSTLGVGLNPIGVGVISRLGYAVVANSGESPSGTASIINISNPVSPSIVTWTTTSSSTTTTNSAVTVGLSPIGVAIDQDRALAMIANSGSNTLSVIDLTVLLPGAVTTTTPEATTVALGGSPYAIAVDPNRAIAVVTELQNSGTTTVTGGLDVINLSTNPPARNSSASVSSLTASPTSIVYDPGDPNLTPVQVGLFYAASTQQNAVYSFNPDTGSTQTIRVGINPYSLGFNYQTGTLLTINSTSNTSSVIDSQNFKMRQTLGISSLSQFSVAVDNLTNIAVIVDQNNNRVLFLALPK